MICPSCGSQVDDNSPSCPVCGGTLFDQNAMQQGYGQPQGMNPMQGGAQPQYAPEPPKKSKTGLIIGIVVAAVAVIAIVLCLVLGVFSSKNGKYVCDDYAAFGMDLSLTVDGDKFTLEMSAFGESDSTEGTIKFKGDKVEMTAEGDTIEGTYSKKDKSITISEEGLSMTFKKK